MMPSNGWGAVMADNPKVARYVWGSIAAIVVVAAIAVLVIKPDLLFSPSKPAADAATVSPDVFMAQPENREAWHDHRAIVTWVASCLGVHSPENLPESLRWSLEPPLRIFSVWKEEQPTGDLTSQHRAVIGLSNGLFLQRVDAVERGRDAFTLNQKFQMSAIIIGLLTTVFISLSSTDIIKDSNRFLSVIKISVKIFAIVLPAVGTAVAASSAFYDPGSDRIKYNGIAESASNLHRQIASGVGGLSCVPAAAKNDKNNADWANNDAQIAEWIKAYKTLTPSAKKAENTATGDSSSDLGNTGGGPPAKQKK
jgi:hypothetical protein